MGEGRDKKLFHGKRSAEIGQNMKYRKNGYLKTITGFSGGCPRSMAAPFINSQYEKTMIEFPYEQRQKR
jgi:hypothetical protein